MSFVIYYSLCIERFDVVGAIRMIHTALAEVSEFTPTDVFILWQEVWAMQSRNFLSGPSFRPLGRVAAMPYLREKPIMVIFTGYTTSLAHDSEKYGSELSLVNMVEYWKKDYRIFVYGDNQRRVVSDGEDSVFFLRTAYGLDLLLESDMVDVVIVHRFCKFFAEHKAKARMVYIWVHDLAINSAFIGSYDNIPDWGRHLLFNTVARIGRVVGVSAWHRRALIKQYDFQPDLVTTITHGISSTHYTDEDNIQKTKNRFIYSSSPDRGLEHILGSCLIQIQCCLRCLFFLF